MTPMGAEDGLRILAARDGCRRIAPRSLVEAPTAKLEISDRRVAKSRESSAGFSEGKRVSARDGGDNARSLGGRRRWQGVSLGSPALDASGTESSSPGRSKTTRQ